MRVFGISLAIETVRNQLLALPIGCEDYDAAFKGIKEALETLTRIEQMTSTEEIICKLVKMKYNVAATRMKDAVDLFGRSHIATNAVARFGAYAAAMDAIGIPADATDKEIHDNYN